MSDSRGDFVDAFLDLEFAETLPRIWVKFFTFQRTLREGHFEGDEDGKFCTEMPMTSVDRSIFKNDAPNLMLKSREIMRMVFELQKSVPDVCLELGRKIKADETFVERNRVLIGSVFPEVIRWFIRIAYQIEMAVQDSNETELSQLVDDAGIMFWSLLFYNEFTEDVNILIVDLLERLCPRDFCECISRMLEELLLALRKRWRDSTFVPIAITLTTYLSSILRQDSVPESSWKVLCECVEWFGSETSPVQALTSDNFYSRVVNFTVLSLERVWLAPEERQKEFVSALFSVIARILPLRNCVDDYRDKFATFLTIVIGVEEETCNENELERIEVKETQFDFCFTLLPTLTDDLFRDESVVDTGFLSGACVLEECGELVTNLRKVLAKDAELVKIFCAKFLANDKMLRRDVFGVALSGIPASNLRFPEETWATLFKPEYILCQNERVIGSLLKLAGHILTGNDKSEQRSLALALLDLIKTGALPLIVTLTRWLRSIDWKSLDIAIDVFSSSALLIDGFIDVDQTLRELLKAETSQLFLETRCEIMRLMECFLSFPAGLVAMFSQRERRVLFVFSLWMEDTEFTTKLADQSIKEALKTLKDSHILAQALTTFFDELATHLTEKTYFDIIFMILDTMRSLDGTQAKQIMPAICNPHFLENLTMIPPLVAEFYKQKISADNSEEEQRQILEEASREQKMAIELLISILVVAKTSSASSKPVWFSPTLIENLISLKPLVEMDSVIIEKLLIITINRPPNSKRSLTEEVIGDPGVLRVLFEWASGSSVYVQILTVIEKLTQGSLYNRYRCYQINLDKALIPQLASDQEEVKHLSQLIVAQIASSFCLKTELFEILNMILNGNPDTRNSFLKLLNDSVESCDNRGPESFFHISGVKTEGLTIENIRFSESLSISIQLRLEQSLGKISALLAIDNKAKSQRVCVQADGNLVRLVAESGDITWSSTRKFGCPYFSWRDLKVILDQKTFRYYVDGVLVHIFDFSAKFVFEPGNLSVTMNGMKCDVSDVKVVTSDERLDAMFTPKLLRDIICVNTVQSSVTGKFEGVTVPFASSVLDTILTSGGSSLYLYILSGILNLDNPSQSLVLVLSGIKYLISSRGEQFIQENFFQEMSCIFKNSTTGPFSKECASALCDIFGELKSVRDQRDMTEFIWSDLSLTSMFDSMVPELYLCGPVPIATIVDCAQCLVSLSFVDRPDQLDGFVELLMAIYKSSPKETEAELILKFIGTSTNEMFLTVLSTVSYQLIEQKDACFLKSIEKTGYLLPFYPLMKVNNVDLHIWAVKLFILVSETFGDNKAVMMLQEILTNAISDISRLSNPTLLIDKLLLSNESEPIVSPQFFQFLPLYGGLIGYLEEDKVVEVTNRVFESIRPESYSLLLSNLGNWCVYLAFFMNLDEDLDRWIGVLASIAASAPETIERIVMTLRIASLHCGWNLEDLLANLLRAFLEKRTGVFDHKIMEFVVKCVLFSIYIECDHQRIKEKSIVRFFEHMSTCSEKVTVKMRVCDPEAWRTSLLVQQTFRLVAETGFEVLGKDVGNGGILGDFLVGIMGILANAPGKPYMGLVDHTITSLQMLEKPNVLVLRAVYLYLLAFFKDDEEVRDALILSIKANEHEMAPYASDDVVRMAMNTANMTNTQLQAAMKTFAEDSSASCYELESSVGHDYSIMIGGQKLIMSVTTGDTMLLLQTFIRRQKQDQKLWNRDLASVWCQLPGSETKLCKKLDMTIDTIGRHLRVQRIRKPDQLRVPHDNVFDVTSQSRAVVSRMVTFSGACRLLTLKCVYAGSIYVSQENLFFESKDVTDSVTQETVPSQTIKVIQPSSIQYILWRKYQDVDNALEVFTLGGGTSYFIFESQEIRAQFLSAVKKLDLPNIHVLQFHIPAEEFASAGFTNQWRIGKITNFEYLFWCNVFSGRSFLDLSQYPIYPQVLADFSSSEIDLNDISIFKDLSISSTPQSNLGYLARFEPFASLGLEPFNSISTDNDTVPEFYCCPDLFHDMELPPWSNSPINFVTMNRLALESPFVSSNLHRWLDTRFSLLFTSPHPQKDVEYPPQMLRTKIKLSMEEVFLDNIKIMRMRIVNRKLVGIDSSGNCTTLTFSENHGCQIKSWKIRSCLESRGPIQTLNNFLHILPDGETIVFSAPWMDTFKLGNINHPQLMVKSRRHTSSISAVAIDTDLVVTGTRDSAISVWHTKNLHNPQNIHGLTSSVACLAVCASMEWLVAVDIDLNLLISGLSTGVVLAKSVLERLPQQIHITNLGYLVFVYGTREMTTILELRDLYGNILTSTCFSSSFCCSCVCQTRDCTEFIACSFENFELVLFRVIDLEIVGQMKLYCYASELVFSAEKMMIIARRQTTNLYRILINPICE